MSEVELSHSARALLRAAKVDAPSAAARAKMWGSVAATAKVGAGAGAGAAAVGGGKLLVMGTIFGSTLTVGLAAVIMHVGGASQAPPHDVASSAPAPRVVARVAQPAAPGLHAAHDASPTASSPDVAAPPVAATQAKAKIAAAVSTKPLFVAPVAPTAPTATEAAAASPSEPKVATDEDPLMREASLLAEARGALARGDAAGALRTIEVAKALPARQLQPEELSLESQTLRALGRAAEARQVGGVLRAAYPDHPLARTQR